MRFKDLFFIRIFFFKVYTFPRTEYKILVSNLRPRSAPKIQYSDHLSLKLGSYDKSTHVYIFRFELRIKFNFYELLLLYFIKRSSLRWRW